MQRSGYCFLSFFFGVVVLPVCLLFAEQFVLPKKGKRKKGSHVLRQQCAEAMGKIMQIMPDIMHVVADTQHCLLSHIYEYLDGEKNCFLACATKSQLIEAQAKLQRFKSRLASFREMLQKEMNEIKDLKASLLRNQKDPGGQLISA